MTTSSEVKRWTHPLLHADARLVLIGRNLILQPVDHFVRGVFIDRTSDRHQPRLIFYVQPLFALTSSGTSFSWCRQQDMYRSDDERFESSFLDLCRNGLADLDQVKTLDDFLRQSETITWRSFGNVPIALYPLRHAEVLAALGRFAEALWILAPAMRDEEATSNTILTSAEAELAKKPRSLLAKDSISHASWRLRQVARLKPLLSLLEANDHTGIAALLRRHEQSSAKLREVDHLWVATPFPFEDG